MLCPRLVSFENLLYSNLIVTLHLYDIDDPDERGFHPHHLNENI